MRMLILMCSNVLIYTKKIYIYFEVEVKCDFELHIVLIIHYIVCCALYNKWELGVIDLERNLYFQNIDVGRSMYGVFTIDAEYYKYRC